MGRRAGRWLAAVVWLALLAAGLRAVTARTAVAVGSARESLAPPPLSALAPRVVDALMLGHRGLYDDFAAVWTLQVLMDEHVKAQDPVRVQALLATVARQQPRIESLYMLSCFVLALDLHRPGDCEAITLDGLKALPTSWRIPVTEAFVETQRGDTKKAALYYGLAASRPGSPDWLKPLAAHLVEHNGLSPEELQQTLDQLVSGPGGARVVDILKGHRT